MPSARLHPNEKQRLKSLQRYEILDTLPELEYDDITLLASRICNTPIAAISLVDEERQWFKSRLGLEATETPRDVAFCAHAILRPGELLEVPDATQDARFSDNPLVLEAPRIRFYAGAPLVAPDQMPIGTLCVIDQEPGELSDEQRESLAALARQVMSQLELRSHIGLLEQQTKRLISAHTELERKQVALDAMRREQLELKDQLLRHVSHELRTPLAALHQFLSLLIDGVGDPEEQRQFLELAFKSANQLKTMISDLLEVARAQTGKLRIDPRLLCLSSVLDDVTQISRERAAGEGLSVELELADEMPIVLADEARVRQVLQNFVENAIKFTPEGGTITVSGRLDDDEPGSVRCSVTDTGCGIAEESLGAIFDQFHQEANQHANSREGLGIGLAICQSLVARMGGRIWVESKLGAGSAFHFTLPIFDLEDLVRRALEGGSERGESRDHLSLIRVLLLRVDGSPASFADPQRRRLRYLLEGLLSYPTADRVLPSLDDRGERSAEYLVAATGARDLPSMLRRLHENLSRDAEIGLWNLHVVVEGIALPRGGTRAEPAAVAKQIEELVCSSRWEGGIVYGEEEGPDRR
jgi:signal transduction histidine kinase